MSVIECDVPAASALAGEEAGVALAGRLDFSDAYRAPLRRDDLTMTDIYFAILAGGPAWMRWLLVARNIVAKLAGLEAPTFREIMRPERKARYEVGEKIGPWPIFHLGPNELVAGRNNRHMDFRMSLLRQGEETDRSVTMSTVCLVHNAFGRYYLAAVIPFHRFGVRKLMTRAVAAKRI